MHNINYIRDNPTEFDNHMKLRGEKPISSKILEIDKVKRETQTVLQNLLSERNVLSKKIGILKSKNENSETEIIQVDKLKDNTYDYSKISKILDEIDKISLLANYEFIDAEVSENIVDNNKINFVFQIKESEKFYVERINIFGNNITEEGFIRQQFIVDEGDPFNKLLHNKSMNKLRSRGIFASVKSEIVDGKDDALKIINVFIDEKPTGEIMAGAGYGTNGSTFVIGIRENNFAGKGITIDSNINLSEESLKGKISYTNPNFRYSDRSLISSIESTTTDKEKDSGYKSSLNRVAIGTSFEQYENFFIRPYFSISNESVTTTANASETSNGLGGLSIFNIC